MIIERDGEAIFRIYEGGHGKKKVLIGHIFISWMGKEHKYRYVIDLDLGYEKINGRYKEFMLTKKEGETIEKFLDVLASLTGEEIFASQGEENFAGADVDPEVLGEEIIGEDEEDDEEDIPIEERII